MTKPVADIREEDWREIYYALDSKAKDIEDGRYSENDRDDMGAWAKHLRWIMKQVEKMDVTL